MMKTKNSKKKDQKGDQKILFLLTVILILMLSWMYKLVGPETNALYQSIKW